MSYGALGLVEVLGSCNAVVVLDQMLKTQLRQKKHQGWWKKRKRNIVNNHEKDFLQISE